MNLLFVLYRYFPFGGLQSDMLAIAGKCHARGHRLTVFTTSWEGEVPDWIDVRCDPVTGGANHTRMQRFGERAREFAGKGDFHQVVGFNKLPGLDMYYAADSCYQDRVRRLRTPLYRLTPRYRRYVELEAAVFEAGRPTRIMMISRAEIPIFQHYYGTESDRMVLLPPGIRRDRTMPPDYETRRRAFRREWELEDQERLVLMVGSGFRTKGLDRAIRAVASLPVDILEQTRFIVVGADKQSPFERLADRLGIRQRVIFTGGRDDVERFLWGADLLIHPAYRENSGMVLLEAMIAGLPVLTTETCGFSYYVRDWSMGRVIGEPFAQSRLNGALKDMLRHKDRDHWIAAGRRFAAEADIFSMTDHAVAEIEKLGAVR